MASLPSNCQCVVFDFDGTLAPNLDLPDMRRQVIELTRDYGVPDQVFADQFIVEIIEVAARWLENGEPANAHRYHTRAHQLIIDIELEAAASTAPFTSTRPLLQALRTRGIRSAIVTRNCRAAIETVFADLHDYVDAVLARDDVTHIKPDTRHLQQALTNTASSAARSVMVGDGQMDMRSGREVGMHCIGVLSGSSDAAALASAGAHSVATDIGAILAQL